MAVDARQIVAFRLERSGLLRRSRDLAKAVGDVGLPDFPPGAALAALAPRLDGAGADTLTDAFDRRTLVRMRAMRGAPVVVRRGDFEMLAAGVLPPDEASMRAFVRPALASIAAAKLSAVAAVEVVTAAADAALASGPLDRDALHAELRKRLPKGLLPYCRGCDSHHVLPSLLYAVALRGRWVLFPQDDGPYVIARADRWLAGKRPGRVEDAPAEILRRFLRAYGPATPADFAAWAGIGGGQPRAIWSAVKDELAPVDVVGAGRASKRWILAADRKALADADPDRTRSVVRLLSAGDPLLQLRDRAVLVPDAKLHKVIWKNLAPTGVLLAGAEVVGVARTRKQKASLEVAIEPIARLDARTRAAAEDEAARLAATRGLGDLRLVWG